MQGVLTAAFALAVWDTLTTAVKLSSVDDVQMLDTLPAQFHKLSSSCLFVTTAHHSPSIVCVYVAVCCLIWVWRTVCCALPMVFHTSS